MSNRWQGGFIQAYFDPLTEGPANSFGPLYAWGNNGNGQTGLNTTTASSSPIQVGLLNTWTSASGGSNQTLALKSDGTLWAWGGGSNGRLGDGTVIDRSSPIQIGSLTTWAQVSAGLINHSAAIKTDGSLWTWGYNGVSNGWGKLGHNDIIARSSPVQVGTLTTWLEVATASYFTAATKTDGTLWTWGYAA